MRVILQCTVDIHHMEGHELWYDFMELPPSINNLEEFCRVAKIDMAKRKVRIVQVMEE